MSFLPVIVVVALVGGYKYLVSSNTAALPKEMQDADARIMGGQYDAQAAQFVYSQMIQKYPESRYADIFIKWKKRIEFLKNNPGIGTH